MPWTLNSCLVSSHLYNSFMMWLFSAVLFFAPFEAHAHPTIKWVFVQSRPLIEISELQRVFSIRTYYDNNRLLLEGANKKQAFFLPWENYAVIDGQFQQLRTPPQQKNGKIYIDAALIKAYLIPLIEEKKQQWANREISTIFSKARHPVCALERPVFRVLLDPGHGGREYGATAKQTKEKNIVLDFALLAVKELEKLGFSVLLSRQKDSQLSLGARTQLAKSWKADVFISIHANASPLKAVRGTETYILSSKASDGAARKLAISENMKNGQEEPKQAQTIKNILRDVWQTAYLQDSAYLAANIQKSLVEARERFISDAGGRSLKGNRGVREAPFSVLKRAAMPAVLVELAYLSNNADRRLLKNKKFQQTLAKALAKGVGKYAQHCQKRVL